MAYRCDNCGETFEEPDYELTSYEDYYGVSSLFPDRHYMYLSVCPNCGSEDIEEFDDEEEEE